MSQSAIELARAAMSAYEKLESFEATQRISAGPINAEARVRFKKPGKITAEYRSYQDPLSEFEEKLTGGPEFAADDLIGMQIVCDGRGTWLHDSGSNAATHKPGRALYTPLPGADVLAEIGFLRDLTRDFLLRDEGEETIAGRAARRLGLKPKAQHRSLLLKEEVFPVEKATLALDSETHFPLRITYIPSRGSALSYVVGPSTTIVIEYESVRLNDVDEQLFVFTPPDGALIFREETAARDVLENKLPFDLHLDVLQECGYKLYGDRATLTIGEEKGRAYTLLTLVPRQQTGEGEPATHLLSLRVGNYLSPNMSRRRAFLAERGERISLDDISARFLDRGALVKDQLPEAAGRKILEVGWEHDGVWWFLLGEELDKEALVELAKALARPGQKAESG
ncbi:MAG: outer membrane lipoprotein carrier protein LolA [Candidatus Bipolaricaulia bacterium]